MIYFSSPISKTKIQKMVDFIVYEPDSIESKGLDAVISLQKDKEMELTVYNMVSQSKRTITLTPSTKWGGKDLLGAKIRYENYTYAHCFVYFVKNVEKHSPADEAGLLAGSDYIIGSKDFTFNKLDDIGKIFHTISGHISMKLWPSSN